VLERRPKEVRIGRHRREEGSQMPPEFVDRFRRLAFLA
jgi:hypothetical protein